MRKTAMVGAEPMTDEEHANFIAELTMLYEWEISIIERQIEQLEGSA